MNPCPVLVLTSSYPRFPGDWPGSFVQELTRLLKDDGHPVRVVAPCHLSARDEAEVIRFPYPGHRSPDSLFYGMGAPEHLLRHPFAALATPSVLLSMAHVAATAAASFPGGDRPVCVSHWLAPSGLAGAWLKARGLVSRHVSIAHGSDVPLLCDLPLGSTLLSVLAGGCDALLAVNHHLALRLHDAVPPTCPVAVEPMGVEDLFSPLDISGLRRGLSLLFLGRVTDAKGRRVLMELATMDRLRLTVAGPIDAEALRSLPTGVRCLGAVPTHARRELFADHHALLFPSISHEGAPRVVMESLSAGRPVVAWDLPWITPFVIHEHNGLLAPFGDVQALKAQVARLATDPDLLRELHQHARDNGRVHTWQARYPRLKGWILGPGHPKESLS